MAKWEVEHQRTILLSEGDHCTRPMPGTIERKRERKKGREGGNERGERGESEETVMADDTNGGRMWRMATETE